MKFLPRLQILCQSVRRSSHEERGLKSLAKCPLFWFALSLLSRGAWIEIIFLVELARYFSGRSSHEERGLKFKNSYASEIPSRRSSHEERGLKSKHSYFVLSCSTSLLSRGAWIEINFVFYLPSGDVSLLSRGAWIEISSIKSISSSGRVAPLTRSVD